MYGYITKTPKPGWTVSVAGRQQAGAGSLRDFAASVVAAARTCSPVHVVSLSVSQRILISPFSRSRSLACMY